MTRIECDNYHTARRIRDRLRDSHIKAFVAHGHTEHSVFADASRATIVSELPRWLRMGVILTEMDVSGAV